MRRTTRGLFFSALILALVATVGAGTATRREAARFKADAYLEHIKYLASDELGGRGIGSPGIDQAAEYIAEQLKTAGCEPAGVDGTWFQPFDARIGKKLVDEEALLEIEGLDRSWKVRQDWIPFPFTDPKDVEGPLAFAGYGIEAESHDYNDYQDFDAEGKVLLIFRYEPKDPDPKALFGGETSSRFALFTHKARTAAAKGAKALLIVKPPNREPDKDELFEFNAFASQQTYQLPMVHITRALADAILSKAGLPDLKSLQEKLDQERKPQSKDLGLSVKLQPGVKPNIVTARNVLGIIRGQGHANETIVVGAHYDHLGLQPPVRGTDKTPQIHNGADDNASGTAGVIELARAVHDGPPLRRNVLFIAFTGEEMGLLGSRHFVEHPTVDLAGVKSMINLDMIGRLNLNQFVVFGTQTAAEFPPLVKLAAAETDLQYRAGRGIAGGSDHAPFARRDIPVMFLFTGTHKEYHSPADDWEHIDADGATRVLQMTYRVVTELANLEEGPAFTKPATAPAEEEEPVRPAVEEQREAAENAASRPARDTDTAEPPGRRGPRVRLGIVPDMAGDERPGMGVQGVTDGTPAQAAGLKEGDRILKIGDEEIRDIYGYMRAMQPYQPGDEVELLILRGEEKMKVKVKLDASRRRGGGDDRK